MSRRKPIPIRPYYTMLTRFGGGPWCPEFGDYDLRTVKDERNVYLDLGWPTHHLKIITTTDEQADIDRVVFELNEAL